MDTQGVPGEGLGQACTIYGPQNQKFHAFDLFFLLKESPFEWVINFDRWIYQKQISRPP